MFAYHYRKITPEVKCKNQQNTIRRPVFLLYLTILHLKSPKNLPHGRFFRGTPERISPFGDKPRIRGAQQKNLPHGRFFGTPERISPLGDKPLICGAQQKNLPRGRFFRGTPERIRTAGLQSRSYVAIHELSVSRQVFMYDAQNMAVCKTALNHCGAMVQSCFLCHGKNSSQIVV